MPTPTFGRDASRLLCALLCAALPPGCKTSSEAVARVKGVAGDLTEKSIDYGQLLAAPARANRPVKVSFFFTYEEFDLSPAERAHPTKENEATAQARGLIAAIDRSIAKDVAKTSTFPPGIITPGDDLFTATYSGKYVDPFKRNPTVPFQIEITLGRALKVAGPDQALVMPPRFMDKVATAMVSSDITMYSGHVWEYATDLSDPRAPLAPGGDNTTNLIRLINSKGPRARLGLIYMNVCKSEAIEKRLIEEALGDSKVIMLSNRYFNNYGFHAHQAETFLTDIFAWRPLPVLMGHMMADMQLRLARRQAPFQAARWAQVAAPLSDRNAPNNQALLDDARLVMRQYITSISESTRSSGGADGSVPLVNATVVVVRDITKIDGDATN